MKNYVAYFEIQADDPGRAIKFYEHAFNWHFVKQVGMPLDYWRITQAGPNGGLLKRPAPAPTLKLGANAFVCSVQTDNFDATTKRIMTAGGQVVLPKFAVPGVCYQGYFLDTEGNTFGLFEPNDKTE
jgi:predicted enzyme related to lactoylglutathione lyase